MAFIRVDHLRRTFGSVTAVDDVSLEIEEGEIFALLGPSGCGKTTILRSISGFETPDTGEILIGEKVVTRQPPHERPIGMVFQAYALFPHMTVFDNVAYGLYAEQIKSGKATDRVRALGRLINRRLARPSAEVRRRVQEALLTVDLTGLEERLPSQLSGGQQQRVALARAIVVEPQVLLMDEPLSNLDRKLRDAMRITLRRLLKRIGITVVIVTHDQDEAMSMADRLAVMKDGNVLQIGTPSDIYQRPINRFVAEFLGDANILEGSLERVGGSSRFVCGDLMIDVRRDEVARPHATVMIRPENIDVSAEPTLNSAKNVPAGVITSSVYLGNSVRYEVEVAGTRLKVDSTAFGDQLIDGTKVGVEVRPEAVLVL